MMRSVRRTRDQIRRLSWLAEAQAVLGWAIILFLLAVLGAIYLNQASHIAIVGRKVQTLQGQLENLKRQNASLEREIAKAQSLERLQAEALRMGFVPARSEDIEYIIVPNYPVNAPIDAHASNALPEVVTKPTPPATLEEALWLTIHENIRALVQGEASE